MTTPLWQPRLHRPARVVNPRSGIYGTVVRVCAVTGLGYLCDAGGTSPRCALVVFASADLADPRTPLDDCLSAGMGAPY